jgi:methionyl-tRNA formyltransferase
MMVAQEKSRESSMRKLHLRAREQSETDFFETAVEMFEDLSHPVCIKKGEINDERIVKAIIDAKPDVLLAYGCSLVKSGLLSAFNGRFFNAHLGLSPYYRGSGTNYWPLVNNEPEYVGVTFMHIDAGVDTGEIIHQVRADIEWGDTPSQIGNRLIKDMCPVYAALVRNMDSLPRMPQPPKPGKTLYYKRRDYTEESVRLLYANFSNGLVDKYISNKETRWLVAPIVENPSVTGASA